MKRALSLVVVVIFCLAFTLCGCKSKSDTSASQDSSEGVVKPMDEYREEAAENIDEQNAEAELKKIEEEVESDVSTEP